MAAHRRGYAGAMKARRYPLRGRVALVTGGSRGLGLALARELAAQGCQLAICGRDADTLERARTDLRDRGAEVLAVRCDVSRRAEAEDLVRQTVDRFGTVDILINNAGIIQVGPAPSATVDHFEDALGVMFWGTVYTTLAAIPWLRAGGRGRIVNVTSLGGKISPPHLLPYNSAKHAAVGFSEGLRAELAPYGIRVTTVVPGLMRTGSHLHAWFGGRPTREYAWFSVLSGAPVLTMDGARAARRIVAAARRGRRELTLTPAAQVASRVNGALPELTGALLALANRLLPAAPAAADPPREGVAVQEELDSGLVRRLTALNQAAARRLNQVAPGSPG